MNATFLRSVSATLRTARSASPIFITAAFAGLLAAAVASTDLKTQLAAAAAVVLALAVASAKDRTGLILFALVLNLQAMIPKLIAPATGPPSGEAPGFYITSADVLLTVLYLIWASEGTLRRDLGDLLASPRTMAPILGQLCVLPSILVAEDISLATAELFRIGWAMALYVFLACRVRSRRYVVVIVSALFCLAITQALFCVWEWRTGNLVSLPVKDTGIIYERITAEGGSTLRPSGTFAVPGLMGFVVGPIALLGLGLSMLLHVPRWAFVGLVGFWAAFFCIFVGQVRASLIGLFAGLALLAVLQFREKRIAPRWILGISGASVLGLAVNWGTFVDFARNNVGTEHFFVETEARTQLFDMAIRMIQDHLVFGVGLGNYAVNMDRYMETGVLLPLPVHNLFLFTWAETGTIGLVGLIISLSAVLVTSIRLSTIRDSWAGTLGAGLAASVLFIAVEEMFNWFFVDLEGHTMYALLAGLTMALARHGHGLGSHDAVDARDHEQRVAPGGRPRPQIR
jgi:hypothetical protein